MIKMHRCALLFTVCLLVSGCATSFIYDDSEYDEKIQSIYTTADLKHLILVGQDKHYIIDPDHRMISALASEKAFDFHESIGIMKLRKDGSFSWSYTLFSSLTDLDDKEIQELKEIGFSKNENTMLLSGSVSGKAYKAGDDPLYSPLSRDYEILIVEESKVPAPVKYTLTPVAFAIDGTVFLGALVVVALACDGSNLLGGNCVIP